MLLLVLPVLVVLVVLLSVFAVVFCSFVFELTVQLEHPPSQIYAAFLKYIPAVNPLVNLSP